MSRDDRSVLGWGAFVVAVAALLVAVFAVLRDDSTSASTGGGGSDTATDGGTTIDVSLTDFKITPATMSAEPGSITINVTNDSSSTTHNFAIPDLGVQTSDLLPGQTEQVTVEAAAGTYKTLCTISGHEQAGMVGSLEVGGGGGANGVDGGTGSATAGGSLHGFANWQEMDAAMEAKAKLFPAVTKGGPGGQLLEPTILPDGTKEFDITAQIVDWEVEPGKIVKAQTYNGTVPGPEIHVEVGDKVRINFKNELNESTTLHFHGIRVPNSMDGVDPFTQAPVPPGGTFVYEFTTLEPAVGIYHSHHDAQVQIPDGTFGAFFIGEMPIPQQMIDKGYTQIDKRVTMVLNDAGVIGLSLNGKSFPATEPYSLRLGQVMEVTYQNEGLQGHPMHLHQPAGWIIAKDGIPLEVPMPGDTIWIAPGERYTVLYKAVDPGVWAWHCHILSHAEGPNGMFGMVTALIVTP